MLLPQGIIAQAIGTAVFPTLSALAARNETAELRRTFSSALRMVLYLATPAGVGLIVLRVPVVQVLLERGRFTQASTDAVALALGLYALGLFAHAGVEIVARTFYALHDTRTPVLIGVAAMAGNVLLSLALIRTPLTFGGLALANSLATTLELAALLWVLRPRLGGVDGRRLGSSLIRILASSGVMALSAAWVIGQAGGWQPFLALSAAVGIGALTYLGASALLGSEEVWAVGRLVRRAVPGSTSEVA
jgi:putative peptidoglycan lipid II flippase